VRKTRRKCIGRKHWLTHGRDWWRRKSKEIVISILSKKGFSHWTRKWWKLRRKKSYHRLHCLNHKRIVRKSYILLGHTKMQSLCNHWVLIWLDCLSLYLKQIKVKLHWNYLLIGKRILCWRLWSLWKQHINLGKWKCHLNNWDIIWGMETNQKLLKTQWQCVKGNGHKE
jgi:hypothetical protein